MGGQVRSGQPRATAGNALIWMEVAAAKPAARTAASRAGCISGKPADKEGEQERRLYGDGEGGQAGRQGRRQAGREYK